jgi:glycosyltransferase involved in cell wall biosynthesis
MCHEVLSFTGGSLEPAIAQAAHRVTITNEEHEIAALVDEGFSVVHLLFERCAHRLAPVLLARSGARIVYGKGYDIGSMYRTGGGFDWPAEESLLAACDAVTFTTPALASRFPHPPGRVCVLEKAVDVARFETVPELAPAAPPRILALANLHPRKRLDDLIAAMPRVRSQVPGAVLRIAGDGQPSRRETLQQLAQQLGVSAAVDLAGWVADVRPELSWCTVVALPSACEGVPTALLEAMAAARPVVATRTGDVASLLDDGAAGLMVEAGDVGALAEALVRVLSDPMLARRLGAAGRTRARRHDVRPIAARVLDVLRGAPRQTNRGVM